MITINAYSTIGVQGFKIGKTPLGRGVFGNTDTVEIEFNRRNIINIESSIFLRSDISLPSWGIISNSGRLTFKDIDKKFLYFADAGWLVEGLKVQMFLKDTLLKKQEMLGTFYTDVWEYDNDNFEVSVSLKDDLEEWQDISVSGFDYDPRNPSKILQNQNMKDFYEWLEERTPEKYNVLPFEQLDEKVKYILLATEIKYPYLQSGTLWSAWKKLCEVCGLYLYKNNRGQTVCKYSYGS